MSLNLGLVGCGGMGMRHAHGYIELRKHFDSFTLSAVCDRHEAAANGVVSAVEDATGHRPQVFTDYETMLSSGVDAVDIVTDTRMHHVFALQAFDAGVHILTEKPMALTMKACRLMRDAAEAKGLVLSIGEQYRRDPMNRLAKALLEAGAIGEPGFAMKVSLGGGSALMHDTGWRALKSRAGSIIIEQGVHEADLLIYFMGDIQSLSAQTGLFAPMRVREGMSGQIAQFYSHRVEDAFANQETVEIDQEDTAIGLLKFASGAIGQLTITNASIGYGAGINTIHGTSGTMQMPPTRTGIPATIHLESASEPLDQQQMLDLVPDWELDDVTAKFFGGATRMGSYDVGFEAIDRILVAIEMQELASAIESNDRNVEVDAEVGMKALAVSYGLLESGNSGQPVSLADIMDGSVAEYQSEIDREAGI